MRAVGDAVKRLGFSETYNPKNECKSESLKVLELGALKCLGDDRL